MGELAQPVRSAFARERTVSIALFLVIVLAIPLALGSSKTIFNDGDVSWHLASGKWMLAHHFIPTIDPFSLTAIGHSWVAMEWLSDLLLASVYSLSGYAGVAALIAGAIIALHAVLFFYLQPRGNSLAIVTTLLLLDFALLPFTLARPHVLVWPLLAAWTTTLLRASQEERAPSLWIALILTLWTNMHASFLIALPVGAAIAFDALQSTGWRNWRDWAAFALASLIALALNANGLRGLLYPFHVAGLAMLPLIQEWQPSTPAFTPQFYVVLGIGLAALLYRGVRVPSGQLVLLLALGGLAFSQVRHQSWFMIVACCVIPPLFRSAPSTPSLSARLSFAALPLLLARAVWPLMPEENVANPRRLIAAAPTSLHQKPVFNFYSFGGPLILAGIRPYIDGRADMYGDPFVLEYSRMMGGDLAAFDRAVQRYHIRWTMLPRGSRLDQSLNASPEWTKIYSDPVGVIRVRKR